LKVHLSDLEYMLAYYVRPIDVNWAYWLSLKKAWETPIVVARDGRTLVDGLHRVAFGLRPNLRKMYPDALQPPEEVECEVCEASTEPEIILERIKRNLSDRKPFTPEDLYSAFTLLGASLADLGADIPPVPKELEAVARPLLRRLKQGYETIQTKGGFTEQGKRNFARKKWQTLGHLKVVADILHRVNTSLGPADLKGWDFTQRMGANRLLAKVLSEAHALMARFSSEERGDRKL
jgi:hypothetical protein